MKPSLKALFFDLDGTLIDSEKTAMEVLEVVLKKKKIDLPESILSEIIGKTWDFAYETMLRLAPEKFQSIDPLPLKKEMIELYQARLKTGVKAIPGAVDFVRSLYGRVPMTVVSGSYRDDISTALEHLKITDQFEFYLGAEDYPRSKPEPDGYLLASKKLGIKPEECIVFEDSEAGLRSARAAGMKAIAITCATHFPQDHKLSCEQIIDFSEMTFEKTLEIFSRP